MPSDPAADHGSAIRFLRDCFAWEFGNQSGQNLRAKSLRARVHPCIDTVLTTAQAIPTFSDRERRKLLKPLQRYQRSSDALYGFLAICARDSAAGVSRSPLCAPLFIGSLELGASSHEDAPVPLVVNRSALTALFDEDTATKTARALQVILDGAPLAGQDMQKIVEVLQSAAPDLVTVGFERFPILAPARVLEQAVRSQSPTLVCTACAFVTQRSRQSMGVLHELEQLSETREFSAPLRQLLTGASSRHRVSGPVFALGALSTPQRQALLAARRHGLSVVHGPPGTGKTHVLTMLALDQLARGQSVLVCARNDAAINVIERFVCDKLGVGDVVVRGGRMKQLRELKARLSQILKQGFVAFQNATPALQRATPDHLFPQNWPLASAVRRSRRALRQLDAQQARLARQIESHVQVASGDASLGTRARHWLSTLTRGGATPLALSELTARWVAQLNARNAAVIEALQIRLQHRVVRAVRRKRDALAQLARSFTAREHNQIKLQSSTNYSAITQPFPLWLCTLANLSQVAPLRRELFDLVIIDEASQADAASALPALQRARRAVIIGDTAQLRHVSFIPRSVEAGFRTVQGATTEHCPGFRDDSVLDWANRHVSDGEASSFLDEHFRSSPDIIGFSNRAFYSDQLKLLTRSRRPSGRAALSLHIVEGGVRGRNEVNGKEADAVVEAVQRLIQKQSALREPSSIGVISAFRAQADAIEKRTTKALGSDALARHAVFCGTAHEWQGEERDVVFFSAAIDDDSAPGSLAFLSRPDVLNVSITRAKHAQRVFLSRSTDRLDPASLFGRYIEWVRNAQERESMDVGTPAVTESAVADVLAALNMGDCRVFAPYAAGRVTVDALIVGPCGQLGIDLIGFPGQSARSGLGRHELELMQRLGTPITGITLDDWQRHREAVIRLLDGQIGALRESGS
ncbi:MAG: AAA domain-containing protein [Pseudomonadota bacterium]